MQLAGRNCRTCNQPIIFATEAKSCDHCNQAIHLSCDSSTNCRICGEPYQYFSRPKRDSLSDAIDPREKRSANSIGPLLSAFLSFLTILLLYYLWSLA